ncbi:MAG: M48 family metalloprotease, partial [Victivallales bacterium]|nr:M48 family metalloprotease [Victivallales bacterium]
MELLNNTVFAALVINLLPQLVILSVIGWVITLIIRRKSAVYRSYVLSSIMFSILLVTFISMAFQLMDLSWGKPLFSISQNQANNEELESYTPPALSEADNIVSTQIVEYMGKTVPATNELSKIENADVNSARAIVITPLLVNCFGILWLGGFLFVLFKLVYSLVFLRGFKAATLTELDDEFMTILREVSEVFKFKYLPEILITKAVASPITIGISRVSVFIPKNLYGSMTEDEFRSILFHEFAHIHHKDHLFSILNKFNIGLNWWNPLVY